MCCFVLFCIVLCCFVVLCVLCCFVLFCASLVLCVVPCCDMNFFDKRRCSIAHSGCQVKRDSCTKAVGAECWQGPQYRLLHERSKGTKSFPLSCLDHRRRHGKKRPLHVRRSPSVAEEVEDYFRHLFVAFVHANGCGFTNSPRSIRRPPLDLFKHRTRPPPRAAS